MATIVSASHSAPARGHTPVEKPLAEFRAFWRAFFILLKTVDSRPEAALSGRVRA